MELTEQECHLDGYFAAKALVWRSLIFLEEERRQQEAGKGWPGRVNRPKGQLKTQNTHKSHYFNSSH